MSEIKEMEISFYFFRELNFNQTKDKFDDTGVKKKYSMSDFLYSSFRHKKNMENGNEAFVFDFQEKIR